MYRKKLRTIFERTDITQDSLLSSLIITYIYIRLCICACVRLSPATTICLTACNERWRSAAEEADRACAKEDPRSGRLRRPLWLLVPNHTPSIQSVGYFMSIYLL